VIQHRYASLAGQRVCDVFPMPLIAKGFVAQRNVACGNTLGEIVARAAAYSGKPADR